MHKTVMVLLVDATYPKKLPDNMIDGLREEVEDHLLAYGFVEVRVIAVLDPRGGCEEDKIE